MIKEANAQLFDIFCSLLQLTFRYGPRWGIGALWHVASDGGGG